MAHGLLVSFFLDSVHMTHASEQAGRPIFEDREFVRIIPIGDNRSEVVEEANDEHRSRFAEEYARFKAGEQEQQKGTPLKEWPLMRPSQIKMLNHLNVFTVENLAECGDEAIQRMGPGGRGLVAQARAYLQKAADSSIASQFAAENQALKDEIASLRDTVSTLLAEDGKGSAKAAPSRKPAGAKRARASASTASART